MRNGFSKLASILLVAMFIRVSMECANGQTIFDFTGKVQTYTVPDNVTLVYVDLWGAGGGNGGGSGAHVAGDLAVTPGEAFSVIVGQSTGGIYYSAGPSGRVFGGGGSETGFSDVLAGGGGGRSAIQLLGVDVVDAAGGGGGTYVTIGAHLFRPGGGGGLTVGGNPTQGPATGGTQTGPGSVGASLYTGGDPISGPGAGGGGGYYGGGAGSNSNKAAYSIYAGAGGSSLLSNLINVDADEGAIGSLAGSLPGGISDPEYIKGIGMGGAAGAGRLGGNGLVIITPLASPVPEPSGVCVGAIGAGILVLVLRKRLRNFRSN